MKPIKRIVACIIASMCLIAMFGCEPAQKPADADMITNAENAGRAKALVALNKTDLFNGEFDDYKIIPTNNYCKWDFEVRDNLTNELLAVVEAKDRKFPSTDKRLKYGGAQLEAPKFELLKSMAYDKDILSYYLCTFEDGTYYIWNIANHRNIKSS